MIQISTVNNENFLIDAIKLRHLIINYLGDIFENDRIIKVFHGCLHSDIGWLQRDFGIVSVNVFDT